MLKVEHKMHDKFFFLYVVDYYAIEIRLFSYRSENIWPKCNCIFCIFMNYEFRIKIKCLLFVTRLQIDDLHCSWHFARHYAFVNMTIYEVVFVDSIVEYIVYSVW